MTDCTQSGFGFEACGAREILARLTGAPSAPMEAHFYCARPTSA
jgi:hypothetical protein